MIAPTELQGSEPSKATEIILVPRTALRPSPLNPRTVFPDQYLNELGLNIRVNGIINALLVRPWRGAPSKDYPDAKFEIVAGDCRWRSSADRPHPENIGERMGPITHLPIAIRELSDPVVLALMLSENMQRNDLTVLEEMTAFARALEQVDEKGAKVYSTIEKFAHSLGKSVKYVGERLSLRKLTPAGRKALATEAISFKTARTICSVPSNIVALVEEEVLNPDKYDFYRDNDNEGPLNAEETLELIHAKFVRELRGAPFDLANPNLVPVSVNEAQERVEGGACADCPWNTANQKSATDAPRKGRGSGEKVFCTNPACFVKKVDVHVAAALVTARESGARILSDKESEKALGWNSPFVNVDEKPDHNDRARAVAEGKCPTWRKIVEGETKPVFSVAVDGKGNVTYLVERKLAVAAAKANGAEKYLSIASGRASSLQDDDADAQRKRDAEKAKERSEISRGIMAALVAAIEDQGIGKDFWPALRAMAKRHAGHAGAQYVCKRRGLEKAKDVYTAVEKALAAAKGSQLQALCIELMLAEDASYCDSPHNGGDTVPQTMRPLLALYKVDPKKVTEKIRAEISERKKAKAAKEKPAAKKPAHPPGTIDGGVGKDVAAAAKKGAFKKEPKIKAKPDSRWVYTPWDRLEREEKEAVRKKYPEGEDSYHACFEFAIGDREEVLDRRDYPPASGNAVVEKHDAGVGEPGMPPERLAELAKIDAMHAAGKKITAITIQSELRLRGTTHAKWLLGQWEKRQAKPAENDELMDRARELLVSGECKSVPALQDALLISNQEAAKLFDRYMDERTGIAEKEIEASGSVKIASTNPTR